MGLRIGKPAWTRTRAVLSLGMVFGLGAVGTLAAWSDSATATTGVFSTSSIRMKVDGQRPGHEFTALRKNSLLPGQSAAGSLTVQNTGSIDYTWTVSAAATGSAALIGKLKVSVHSTGANNGSTCTGPALSPAQTLTGNPTLASGQVLAAGGSAPVCVQVSVDASAGATEQFKVAAVGFNFTATGV